MKNKILLGLLFLTPPLPAQQDTTALNQWIPSAVVGLNISQITLSNWAQGGANSITYAIISSAGLKYNSDRFIIRNHYCPIIT